MKKTVLFFIITIFIIALPSCNKGTKDSKTAETITVESEVSGALTADEPVKDDIFNIKVYSIDFTEFMEIDTPFRFAYTYETIGVSRSRMKEDTFEYARSIGFTDYESIWYEGNKLYVDLSQSIADRLNSGGTYGSAVMTTSLIHTLLSFPDVEELEFLLEGHRGRIEADHFTLNGIYTAADSKKFLEENALYIGN
jgi:hypothetical protein